MSEDNQPQVDPATDEVVDEQAAPVAPPEPEFTHDDPKILAVHERVREALAALPFHFTSPINIEGLDAGDLFSLNSLLGGAIEIQTVDTLNRMRAFWDPDDEFPTYGFRRYPQSFPDVRLIDLSNPAEPLFGIELKGWYLLSKEKEPSFRFTATAAVCAPLDLLVVVPWSLSNVLSGTPRAHEPYVASAKWAADMRTFYWQHGRAGSAVGRNTEIKAPEDVHPYPSAKARIGDKPVSDSGGNFGRVARVKGLMDDWTERLLATPVSGIACTHWVDFLKAFTEDAGDALLKQRLESALRQRAADLPTEAATSVVEALFELNRLMSHPVEAGEPALTGPSVPGS